jgi:hypothetical protein
MNDLFALAEFYRPMRIGDPFIAYPDSVGRSEGFFERTVVLANPSVEEVKQAFDVLMHWIGVNSSDPEFEAFQINIAYSGHADCGDSLGQSCLFLGDIRLPTKSIVEYLLASTERQDVRVGRATVNVLLDCCHSAAVARDLMVYLQAMQDQAWRASERPLYACNKLYCSSLDDEESFDEVGLGRSYFVAAYLRENSRSRMPSKWPFLHDVGSRTAFAQNPIMISVEPGGGLRIRFPSSQLLKEEFKTAAFSPELQTRALQDLIATHHLQPTPDGYFDVHPIDFQLATFKLVRQTVTNPDSRTAAARIPPPSYEERIHYWVF